MRDLWRREWFGPGLLAGLSLMPGCNYAAQQRGSDAAMTTRNWQQPNAVAAAPAGVPASAPLAAAHSSPQPLMRIALAAQPQQDGDSFSAATNWSEPAAAHESAAVIGKEGQESDLKAGLEPHAAAPTADTAIVQASATVMATPPSPLPPVAASDPAKQPPGTVANPLPLQPLPAPTGQPRAPAPMVDPAVIQATARVTEVAPQLDTENSLAEVRKASGRKSAGNAKTTPVRYGHAADYAWLMGELQYIQTRKAWHLRFAPTNEQESYGGTVTLVGDGLTSECKNGQVVRVEGDLINPESGELRPLYWVRSLRILKSAPPIKD